MSNPKKKRLHYCRYHPKIVAVGRCASCRSWICRDCAGTDAGRLHCINNCARRKSEDESRAGAEPADVSTGAPAAFHGLMLLAAITLGLCGVVFGLWGIRQQRAAKAEVDALKEKRIELIGHIKDANSEIASLRAELDSLRPGSAPPAIPVKKKTVPSAEPLPPPAQSIMGLPLSFENGNTGDKVVALTFDGGSEDNAADDILDTLKSRNVKATMFLTGRFMRAFPATVKRIAADGHEIGSHTFSHPHLTSFERDRTQTTLPNVTESFLCRELSRTDSVFVALTGNHLSPIWRAPYGEKNRSICVWAQRCGYLHVGWRQGRSWRQGLDSNDWIADEETAGFHSPEEVLEKILTLAKAQPDGISGGIILMHLGTVRKDAKAQVHRILGKLIDELTGLGYGFATAQEMLKASGVDVELLRGKSLTRTEDGR